MSEIQKIASILDCMDKCPDGLTNKDISEMTGIPLATSFRILKELSEYGLVFKQDYSRHYFPGEKLAKYSRGLFASSDLIVIVRPFAEQLHKKLGLRVFFSTYNGICCTVADIQGQADPRTCIEIGEVMPLHCSASGKIILAHMTKREQDEFLGKMKLESFTENTPRDIEILKKQIAEAKRNGIYIAHSEFHTDAISVSAPVFDSTDVIGSLTVIGTGAEFPDSLIPTATAYLRAATKGASLKIFEKQLQKKVKNL